MVSLYGRWVINKNGPTPENSVLRTPCIIGTGLTRLLVILKPYSFSNQKDQVMLFSMLNKSDWIESYIFL